MQFHVPQFIEVEDKIIGPLTFKQFVYVAGGCGLAFVLWQLLPAIIAAPFVAISIGTGVALAFFKYNGQPLIVSLEHGFYFLLSSKLYLWDTERKKQKKAAAKKAQQAAGQLPSETLAIPKLSQSKLHELAWSLDIKEKLRQAGVRETPENTGQVTPTQTF